MPHEVLTLEEKIIRTQGVVARLDSVISNLDGAIERRNTMFLQDVALATISAEMNESLVSIDELLGDAIKSLLSINWLYSIRSYISFDRGFLGVDTQFATGPDTIKMISNAGWSDIPVDAFTDFNVADVVRVVNAEDTANIDIRHEVDSFPDDNQMAIDPAIGVDNSEDSEFHLVLVERDL